MEVREGRGAGQSEELLNEANPPRRRLEPPRSRRSLSGRLDTTYPHSHRSTKRILDSYDTPISLPVDSIRSRLSGKPFSTPAHCYRFLVLSGYIQVECSQRDYLVASDRNRHLASGCTGQKAPLSMDPTRARYWLGYRVARCSLAVSIVVAHLRPLNRGMGLRPTSSLTE